MLLLALLASLVVQEAPAVDPDCVDAYGTDRCAAENRTEVLRTLGMASLEEEKAAGAEIYRVMQINGYGRVMPAIAYERRPGTAPQVVIYAAGGNRLTAAVPLSEWTAVQGIAELADRKLEPLAATSDLVGIVCFHAWISTVEIANAANRGVPDGPIRRRTESACGGDLTTRFASDLASLAVKRFPECEMLDPEKSLNDVTRLAQCAGFKGDRVAAADLNNQIGWRLTPDQNADQPRSWTALLGINNAARLDWAGESIVAERGVTGNRVAEFLAQRQAETPSLRAFIEAFNGVSSTRVEATGTIGMDGPNDSWLSTPFSQVWVWDSFGMQWKLERWIIEPFPPAT